MNAKTRSEDMLIVIPTYGRVNNQKTYNAFPDKWKKKTWFVVRPEEADAVRRINKNVIVCSKVGVPAARQAALEALGTKKCVAFFDDDLQFSMRGSDWEHGTNTKLYPMKPQDVGDAMLWMQQKLVKHAMVGLDSRGGNNNRPDPLERMDYRIMRAFAVNQNVLRKHNVAFDKYKYWEDFHVTLCLLKLGYHNIVSMTYTVNGLTNSKGGCSSYRNIPEMIKEQKRFIKEHTPFAVPVDKNIKSWTGEFAKQNETAPDLKMYWRKAIAHGVEKHGDR